VGGRVPGSNASDSTEIYAEGLRIPPLKLYDQDQRNETIVQIIERNVRVPVRVFGDLRAQLAACHIAERQILELAARYGRAGVRRHMEDLLDYSERMTRAALSALPDGAFSFEDWIDDDGIDVGRPIRLLCTITKADDRITVDWTGTSPQVKGAINNTFSFTKAASYTAVKSVISPDIPTNDGVFRAIEVIAPPGTIAHGVLPAACAARGLTGFRMLDCAFGALAAMLPDRVMAASEGGNTGITIGGWDAGRRPFIYVDFACGVWGGRPWADGLEGNSNLFVNMASHSVEITEGEQPIQILAYQLVPDRSGPGKFRGGTPYRRDYRLLADEAILQVRADRQVHRPYGLYGGEPGAPSVNVLNPESDPQPLPGKVTLTIRRGDVFRHELAGGGGWGDPLERDPERVLSDVRDELITEEFAREAYGVAIDRAAWTIDAAATRTLRAAHRATRAPGPLPKVGREPSRRPPQGRSP
jgi:N-methylhydantoinase B